MPSRNNINLPKALNRRVLSHRRVAVRTKTRTANSKVILHRTAATDARPRGDAGVVRGGTISKKRAKKDARNKNFVLERKKEEAAEILLKEKKEVEMIDIATVPLSKRQAKLQARAAKNAEDNAKAKVAIAAEKAEAEKKKAEEAGAEATMDVDLDI